MRTSIGIRDGVNQQGQPLIRAYRQHAVAGRQIDELLGIIKGLLADGTVDQSELEFLIAWLRCNAGAAAEWPGRVIYSKVVEAMADGVWNSNKENEMLALLLAAVGGNGGPAAGESSDSTALPYSFPLPHIEFCARVFCFTGKFNCGTRDWCHGEVQSRGGLVQGNITRQLDFLVIGEIASRDWRHSTHGNKILKAVEYRDSGVPIAIVGEQHWLNYLDKFC